MLAYSRVDSTSAPSIDDVALAVLRARLPERVLLPTSAADVIAAIDFAREQQLPVGVKATGHNFGFRWPGGLMINTERMQGVTIDPIQRTARVEAGVKWMSVISAAHE